MDIVTKKDFKMLSGEVTIPADKSISHRAIIFSALAKGKSSFRFEYFQTIRGSI